MSEAKQTAEGGEPEPVRLQTFGALLAMESDAQYVVSASANCSAFLGRPIGEILGASLDDLLGVDTAHDVRNVLTLGMTTTQRQKVCNVTLPMGEVQLSTHCSGPHTVLEMMAVDRPSRDGRTPLDNLHFLVGQIQGLHDVHSFLDVAVDELRVLTGFDRVLAHRYSGQGSGDVIAEARNARVRSCLGQAYPSPILDQQRALYRVSPAQVVADISAEDQPMVSGGDTAPLDTSLSVLRAKSSAQSAYLASEGMRSALTLPIVIGGDLWGLFTLHHRTPYAVGPDLLLVSQLAIRFMTMHIGHLKR